MSALKILVVEDEGLIAKDLTIRLKRMGYPNTQIAFTGEEAIELIPDVAPDLILMDIKLNSEIDGIETAQRIRTNYNIPVVYVTAYADDETLIRAKITEPYGYVIKPFNNKELQSTIEMALYKSKMDRMLIESEERYRLLIENQKDFIIKADLEGRFIFVSPSFCKALGEEVENLLSKNFLDWIHEDHRKLVENSIASLRKSSNTSDFEINYKTKDGFKWIAWATNVQLDNEGKAVAFVANGRDITERKLIEQVLQVTNEQLEAERSTLKEKNLVLKEVLNQIDNEKNQIRKRIQSNIDRIAIPILEKIENKIEKSGGEYIPLLRDSLEEITSPFINKLEVQYSKLTPREVEICNMVKSNLTSKEIASMLHTSEQTIRKQRKNIRRKLDISGDKVNLSSFLQTL